MLYDIMKHENRNKMMHIDNNISRKIKSDGIIWKQYNGHLLPQFGCSVLNVYIVQCYKEEKLF